MKMKKMVAVLLTAIMVLSSSVVALADASTTTDKTVYKSLAANAEIYAVNKLLLDNPNAQIGDIAIYVNRTLGTSKPVIEIPFETCPHCRYILEGFNIISNN